MAQGICKHIVTVQGRLTFPKTKRTFAWGTAIINVGGHTGTVWGSANTGLYIHEMKPAISFNMTFSSNPYIYVTKSSGSGALISWVRCSSTEITDIDFISPVQTPVSGSSYAINWLAIGTQA